MNPELDDSIKAAFAEIVAHAPDAGPVPSPISQPTSPTAPVRRYLLAAAAVLVVAAATVIGVRDRNNEVPVAADGGPVTTVAFEEGDGLGIPGISTSTSSEATDVSASAAARFGGVLDESGWDVELVEHATRGVGPGVVVQWAYFGDGDRRLFIVEGPADLIETDLLNETAGGYVWPSEAGALTVAVLTSEGTVIVRSESVDGASSARVSGDLLGIARQISDTQPADTAVAPGMADDTNQAIVAESFSLPEWLAPRGGHTVSWTGTETIVWGGWSDETGSSAFADGAAYDPSTGSWRPIAEGPLAGRAHHIAVWANDRLIIVGGQLRPGELAMDAATYDPASDTWTSIEPSDTTYPATSPPPVEAVWTGTDLVVWYRDSGIVQAFDPATNTWRDLPDLDLPRAEQLGALRWTGTDLVALAGDGPGAMTAATLRPDVDSEWVDLPPVEFGRECCSSDPFPTNSAVADGELIVWSRSGQDAPTFRLDLAARQWVEIPTIPINSCEGHVTPLSIGSRILAIDTCSNTGGIAIYDDPTQSWTTGTLDPADQINLAESVWTGTEVLAVHTTCCYGSGGQPFQWEATRLRID